MEQFVGMSKTGSIKEAAEGLKNPQFLMLFDSSKERFKESVSQLEEMFPGVPSIGCVGQFYGKTQVQSMTSYSFQLSANHIFFPRLI